LLFGLKKFVAVQSQKSDQETNDVVQDWLQGLAATFFVEGMQKPIAARLLGQKFLSQRCVVCLLYLAI
jgi:hypothetical protein